MKSARWLWWIDKSTMILRLFVKITGGNVLHSGLPFISLCMRIIPTPAWTMFGIMWERLCRPWQEKASIGYWMNSQSVMLFRGLTILKSARYDSITEPQGHFICEICGEITNFTFPEAALPATDSSCGEARHVELRLSGICEKCRQGKTF